MSWSADFIARLGTAARGAFLYAQVLATDVAVGDGSYSLASIGLPGTDTSVRITTCRPTPQSIQPGTWQATLGGWTMRVIPVEGGDVQDFLQAVPRGAILGLYAAVGEVATTVTLDSTGLALVGVGIVATIQPAYEGRAFAGLEVTVIDLPRATLGRLTRAIGSHALFAGVGTSTTLTAASAVADGTYDLTSTTGFARRFGSLPYGCALVDSAAGDPYYRLWSASTSTTLTIQSAGTASVMGTTDVGASSGDTITACWYLRGHPLDIAREVLCSRDGSAANGPYDVLPTGWGIGVPDSLLDHGDIDNWKSSAVLTPSSGAYVWEIAGTDEKENPWSFLADTLARGGYFMAMRQGRLTVRPAQHLNLEYLDTGIEIVDGDVVAVGGGDLWDTGSEIEYGAVTVTTATTSSTTTSTSVLSQPAGDTYPIDYSDRQWTNPSAVAAMEAGRLSQAWTSISERVRLVCGGLRLAVLTLGDVVHLSTTCTVSRYRGKSGFAFDRAMVVSHAVDWLAGTVELELALWPTGEHT